MPGAAVAGILERLEAWAADSPERSRTLVLMICAVLGTLVLIFICILAYFLLDADSLKDLTE